MPALHEVTASTVANTTTSPVVVLAVTSSENGAPAQALGRGDDGHAQTKKGRHCGRPLLIDAPGRLAVGALVLVSLEQPRTAARLRDVGSSGLTGLRRR